MRKAIHRILTISQTDPLKTMNCYELASRHCRRNQRPGYEIVGTTGNRRRGLQELINVEQERRLVALRPVRTRHSRGTLAFNSEAVTMRQF
jgi:hypothetical protein